MCSRSSHFLSSSFFKTELFFELCLQMRVQQGVSGDNSLFYASSQVQKFASVCIVTHSFLRRFARITPLPFISMQTEDILSRRAIASNIVIPTAVRHPSESIVKSCSTSKRTTSTPPFVRKVDYFLSGLKGLDVSVDG